MKVITLCIDQLIDTLPTRVKNTKSPLIIDLILSGGFFNGSYMLGSLLFLKEMEKRNYVKVNRISTCSISSLLGVLYITDKLDALCNNNYEVLFNQFIETQQMCCMLELRKYINIDPSDLFKINNKLYISYYNVRKQKKNTKCFFKTTEVLYESLIKSSFIPFVLNTEATYKNKYIDGITPKVFKTKKTGVKLLSIDVILCDKFLDLFNVKNEYSNIHRTLIGILDIHKLFLKDFNSTSLCRIVNTCHIRYRVLNYIVGLFEKLMILAVVLCLCVDDIFMYFGIKQVFSFFAKMVFFFGVPKSLYLVFNISNLLITS
jgi:hypothetical protein